MNPQISLHTLRHAVADKISRYFKDFTYKFRINILKFLQRFFIRTLYLSTADIDTFFKCIFVRLFTAPFWLPWQCRYEITTTSAAAEASYGRARSLSLFWLHVKWRQRNNETRLTKAGLNDFGTRGLCLILDKLNKTLQQTWPRYLPHDGPGISQKNIFFNLNESILAF